MKKIGSVIITKSKCSEPESNALSPSIYPQAFHLAPHVDDVVEERLRLLEERRALAQDRH